jgi:hypothetical protein
MKFILRRTKDSREENTAEIEIYSLEELWKLHRVENQALILYREGGEPCIEIYDDNRE